MRADRGVDARRRVLDNQIMQRFAHAVQPLEFIAAFFPALLLCQHHDAGHRARIMRGELRKKTFAVRQYFRGAGEVRHIGMFLARKHRIGRQPGHLRPFDFRIPVRALDQPQRKDALMFLRQIRQPIDDIKRALLVGLHDKADAVPPGQGGIGEQLLKQQQFNIQPRRFLGVDGYGHARALRLQQNILKPRQQFLHHALTLRERIARMQRREFDRDARRFEERRIRRDAFADERDALAVGVDIGQRLRIAARAFAQNIVGKTVAALGERLGAIAVAPRLWFQPARTARRSASSLF